MARWNVRIAGSKKTASNVSDRAVAKGIQSGQLGPDDLLCPIDDESAGFRPLRDIPGFQPILQEMDLLPAGSSKASPKPRAQVRPPKPVAAAAPPVRPVLDDEDEDDMPLRLSPRQEDDELDLTSMVDVTFLLLLFFMLTASYNLQASIDRPLPDTDEEVSPPSQQDPSEIYIIVRVDGDNIITVDEEEAEPADLQAAIQRAFEESGKNEVLIVQHDDSWHEFTVRIHDAATAVGIQAIRESPWVEAF